ncbi:hypothetical protein CC1G_06980 [Coprinopsis cinerea okayama7|uniref:Uncharacterized protein n=1 Tax=Coprinopsis cinerea (strain Okayama-7 / 130 / ATCC MYA-4618 / FGSC 9003) TaxID=240176 RepID=A8NAS7_COPC7|nr:hypothetical protein CC1G_06980 [Coprinopsis cinerea okayama7\|eukprot:XP_001831929.1 hypothetical protein CC1G_06980 [Coprinopsis cinerea okayama7\
MRPGSPILSPDPFPQGQSPGSPIFSSDPVPQGSPIFPSDPLPQGSVQYDPRVRPTLLHFFSLYNPNPNDERTTDDGTDDGGRRTTDDGTD